MLTKEQQSARKGKLGSSQVACLMTGDAAEILQLYKELIGEAEHEDLSDNWAVRAGEKLEPLNLEWFERKNSVILCRQGEVVQHPEYGWAICTLDAYCKELACVVEAKAVGGREPIEVVIDRYQPQMQWQMGCVGCQQVALSLTIGLAVPVVEFVERDTEYQTELFKRAGQFMWFVNKRQPPVALPPVAAPVVAQKLYDMSGNQTWFNAAASWLQTYGAAQTARDAEKTLKAMVPEDAKICTGHGVRISRNRGGALSLREDKE